MAKRRRLVWLGAEALTVAWVLACGRVDDSGHGGSGGTASGGHSTGGATVGGGPGAGGTGPGAGGTLPGGGGSPINPTPDVPITDACGVPVGVFDPPCSEADVLVEGHCIWVSETEFSYPLTDLEVPTQPGLQLVLLPKADSTGFGGDGSAAAPPLILPVSLSPDTAGMVTDAGFSVTMTGATLVTSFQHDDVSLEPYLEEVWNSEESYYPYHTGDIAILDGQTILDQKRLLVEPFYPCIVK